MVLARVRTSCIGIAALFLLIGGQSGMAQDDPPSRVARLNYVSGNVSMQPAGASDWMPAELNRPFTIGDYLYADQSSDAELHLDVAAIRLGPLTNFGFLNLDDQRVQLRVTEGDLYIKLHDLSSDQAFEVDTPNAAVTLLRDGTYRFRVDANGSMSFVVVRQGSAEITGGGQAFTLNPGNSAMLTGSDQLAFDVELAPAPDEFDQWCQERDAREVQLISSRYLPRTVIGYEDLDNYGTWQNADDYGPVWYPRSVDTDWAPYHNGHWAWIEPWGWTWVDSMPWGFAPFHYGRWAYIGNRWGWCPGPIAVRGGGPVVRPYYAPALVAWFGGEHWGVSISFGGGPSLGWVPLGRGEVYTPAYHCSPRYFNNVNVTNTRIVNTVNITNVYHNVYVNKTVYNQQYVNVRAPNAVMAMPEGAFASGRAVRGAATPVRPVDLGRLQNASVVAPPVNAPRQSFVATNPGRPIARPPAQVVQRPVIVRSAPPPVRAAAAGSESFRPQQAVRQVPPARPIVARPGMQVGHPETTSNRQDVRQASAPAPFPTVRSSTPPPMPAIRNSTPSTQRRPETMGQQPELNRAQPELNRAQPELNRAQPELNRAQPEVNRTQPQVNRGQPEANRAQPSPREPQPELRRQQPQTAPSTERSTVAQPPTQANRPPQPARIEEPRETAPRRANYPERRTLNEERNQPANKPAEGERRTEGTPHPDRQQEDHSRQDRPKDDHQKKDH